ncbi:MAG: acetoacetate decarboxylase family protein [Actinomycetota bacterium]
MTPAARRDKAEAEGGQASPAPQVEATRGIAGPARPGPRRASAFFKWSGPARTGVDIGGFKIDLPIRYYRTDCFVAIFDADYDATRAMLPSGRLNPVRLARGRAAVALVAFNYLQTGVGPYGEIGIVALCTLDKQAPPLAPLMLESRWPGFGAFVAHLPVTTRIARQAGRTIWGYPKFVADMAFDFMPEYQSVDMREGGKDIFSLTVPRRGPKVTDKRPLVTFTVREGELIRTVMPWRAVYQMGVGRRMGGSLVLGDHPVAEELRALALSSSASFTKSYLAHAGILPEGEVLGSADMAYEGFAGSARVSGLHTVRYDNGVEMVVTSAEQEIAPDSGPAKAVARVAAKAVARVAAKGAGKVAGKVPAKVAGKVPAKASAKGTGEGKGKAAGKGAARA